MVRMLPPLPPRGVSAGEAEMFRLIRQADDASDWVCLHSLGLARHERKEYAEADFVLINPDGVFCIEVKGGEVRRHGGQWEIGWPGKTYMSGEGPFKQAQGARWALRKHLEAKLPHLKGGLLVGWGVAFPDIIFDQSDPEWDQDVIYDQRDKGHSFKAYGTRLGDYFRARFDETGKRRPPRLSPSRIREIVDALRGDFEFVPKVASLLADSERELISLSPQQFAVLDFALNDDNPRILCEGAAGTGKTVVAVEAARRLAATGRRVLLVCFNENLAHFLKLDARQEPNFEVRAIYNLLGELIGKAGLSQELRTAFGTLPRSQVFDEAYPRIFESACLELMEAGEMPSYDALVVDEAQDILSAPLMNCLDLLLKGGFGTGNWMVFYDGGFQAGLYSRLSEDVLRHLRSCGAVKCALKDNYRNPKTIVSEMCAVTGASMPICKRETPSPVDYRVFADEREQGRKLRALLVELLKEGVRPEQVTILSANEETKSCVATHPPDVGKRVEMVSATATSHSPDTFTAGSISGFKGLENDVVILTDLREPAQSPWLKSLLYVGMTRARAKLYMLTSSEFADARFASEQAGKAPA